MSSNSDRLASEHPLHRLLEWPPLYRLATLLLAPGAEISLGRIMRECAAHVDLGAPALDVGCGPMSRLKVLGFTDITGVDVSPVYIETLQTTGVRGVTSSAGELPFPNGSFASVWNVGLLHHLEDPLLLDAIREMLRVCAPSGHVIVIDAVLPRSPWTRPLAWLARRLDRGRNMRLQEKLQSMLDSCGHWEHRRATYALNGLECLISISQPGATAAK